MVNLTVNGEKRQLPDNATVQDLVAALGLAGKPVAVEVNRNVVPKRQHAAAKLAEDDVIEVVTLVGGG